MSIEELVNRAYTTWAHDKGTSWTDHMRAALTEQAETHALELRAYEATVANLEQRIRELEATVSEYDRRIVAVGGVAINSVSREHHDAEVARLNGLYQQAVAGRQAFREKVRELEAQRVPDIRCKCCGYLVTESEHRGCLRSAIDGHLLASLRLAAEALHALTDRNITYIGNDAVLPFESNAQAFNHMIDARRHAKEAMEMLAAAIAKAKGETK